MRAYSPVRPVAYSPAFPVGGRPDDFLPAIIPGVALWLRADRNITLNGSTVSHWGGLVKANNATQSTEASQPAFDADAVGGKPGVVFDGAADQMDAGDIGDVLGGLLFVFRPDAAISAASAAEFPIGFDDSEFLIFGPGTGLLTNEIITVGGATGGQWRVGWTDAAANVSAAAHILVLRWTGSTYEIRLDGAVKTTTASGTPAQLTLDNFRLGNGQSPSDTLWFDGGMSEVAAIAGSGITVAQAQALEAYAASRYGVALP